MFSPSQQFLYPVFEHQKTDLLVHLIKNQPHFNKVVVYVRTRDEAHRVTAEINADERIAEVILLNTKESFRKEILQDFLNDETRVLVTMDASAREISFSAAENIINFDFPETITDYVRRIEAEQPCDNTGICITLHLPQRSTPLEKLESSLGYSLTESREQTFKYDSKAKTVVSQKKKAKSKASKPNKKNKRK